MSKSRIEITIYVIKELAKNFTEYMSMRVGRF